MFENNDVLIPKEYCDKLATATCHILEYAGTLGTEINITFNLQQPTVLGRFANFLSPNATPRHDRLTITALTQNKPESKTALGQLFTWIDSECDELNRIERVSLRPENNGLYIGYCEYNIL